MSSKIYKCDKCSEFSKFNEESNFHGLGKNQLFTDDSSIVNRKEFIRCPHCYNIIEAKIALIDSQGYQTIVRKSKDREKAVLQKTTKSKCIELNLMEYYDLLSIDSLSKEQELNIRVQILSLENDKRREWQDEDYEVAYNNNEINNFIELEKLLDLETGQFLFVDIKRYLKKFDEATVQLKLLHDILDTKAKLYLKES